MYTGKYITEREQREKDIQNRLYESYMRSYDSAELKQASREIAEQIVAENRKIQKMSMIARFEYCNFFIYNDSESYNCKRIEFRNHHLDWIDEINIYISSGYRKDMKQPDNKFNYFSNWELINETVSSIISDTKVARWDNENDDFIFDDSIYAVATDLNTIERPYQLYSDNSKIKCATILFVLPDNSWDAHDIAYIVQHEICHIYDLFNYYKELAVMNRDIICGRVLVQNKNNIIYVNQLLNPKIKITKKNDIIKQVPDIVSDVFVDCVYMLNTSEMNARLSNFEGDVERNIQSVDVAGKAYTSKYFTRTASEISPSFAEYQMLVELFTAIINNTPEDERWKFVNLDIRKVYGVNTKIGGCMYNNDFRMNGEYNLDSFELFFKIQIWRIQTYFIKPAMSYLRDNHLDRIITENWRAEKPGWPVTMLGSPFNNPPRLTMKQIGGLEPLPDGYSEML